MYLRILASILFVCIGLLSTRDALAADRAAGRATERAAERVAERTAERAAETKPKSEPNIATEAQTEAETKAPNNKIGDKIGDKTGDKTDEVLNLAVFKTSVEAYRQNQLDQSKKYLLELQKQFPDSLEILNNLAVIELQQGNRDRAIQLLKTVMAADETIYASYRNLSRIYAHAATQAYRDALSLESKSAAPPKLTFIGEAVAPAVEEPIAKNILQDEQIDQPLVEEPEQASINGSAGNQILESIDRWATAWSEQNLSAYFSSYAQNYAPPRKTNEEWRAQRLLRIKNPARIEITLSNIRLSELGDDRVRAIFKQSYKSNHLNSTVLKQLILKRSGEDWIIINERVLPP